MKKPYLLILCCLLVIFSSAQTAQPLTASAVSSHSICAGDSVLLDVLVSGSDSNYSVSWSPADGLSDPSLLRPKASPDVTTEYILTLSDSSGNTVNDTVVVMVDRPYGVVTSSGNQSICAGDSLLLTVNTDASNTILWNNGNTAHGMWVKEDGDYLAMLTSPQGCMAYADNDILVSVLTPPPAPLIESNSGSAFCAGDSLTLTAQNPIDPVYYNWNTGSTDTSINIKIGGKYSVYVTDITGCRSETANMDILVHPLPTGNIVAESGTAICVGDSIRLNISGVPGGTALWSTGVQASDIWVKIADSISAQMISAYGCTAPALNSVTTILKQRPQVYITQQGNFLNANSASFYQWYYKGQPIAGATNASLVIRQGGDYSIELKENGCSATGSISAVLRRVHESMSYQVYPNPVINDLHILYDLKTSQKVSISILDIMGRRLQNICSMEQQAAGEHTYLLSNLANRLQKGHYTVLMQFGDEKITEEIIIL
ncbi:MAG: T9SS type A sorting domain-containing protein [Flavisolibacter sp.]